MDAEIISVGTELLLGQITDTNRPYIAKHLSGLGLASYHQSIVGDNYQRMYDEMAQANSRSDLVILIGGLGPTEDDLTKQVAADVLGKSLVDNDQAMAKVENWHRDTGVTMVPSNRLQAQYIEGGQPIKNDIGFAIGSYYQNENGADFLLLPGPPWELEPMFDKYVLPLLQSVYSPEQVMSSLVLRYYGIGESRLETELRPLIDTQTNPTIATYAKKHEVTVRLTAQATTKQDADALNEALAEQVNAIVGDYLYGYGDANSLAAMTNQALTEHNLTVSVADAYTNWAIADQLDPAQLRQDLDLAATIMGEQVPNAEAAADLAETLQVAAGGDIVLTVLPSINNPEVSMTDTNFTNELVHIGLKYKDNDAQSFTRTLGRAHRENIDTISFVGLDTIRRTALNLPLLNRK
ncbi:CinA family nicotinamide mononucleotide deamidase-related protein [Weissella viridescens]|uniref:CinA family nicotinamide mononucleotide deamidase-related protein n=1 Tax=Weissella viridescens TaxID=1629 RepID=UPI002576D03F|nr:CinA family nicotinamide mononucleotide deamidase-related protein [Weissella viridescens]WJI91104.1 CinA family nicotinamide mononucleotide deamidase-related protein [Weissella viridescens]